MKMRELTATRTIAAAALLVGAALSAPAKADTDRTDCMGNNCVRIHCYDDTGTCTPTTNFQVNGQSSHWIQDGDRAAYVSEPVKPRRYACDSDGDNCHWTRNYYYNDDGDPIDDSALYP